MSLLTVLTVGVGSGIAKGVLSIWLQEEPITSMIGKEFVSLLASKTNDELAQRKGNRQFEIIGEKVAENLLPLFNSVGSQISDEKKIEIAQLTGIAVNNIKLTPELLLKHNLNPEEIERILLQESYFPNEENPFIDYTKEESTLYKNVISEAAQYMVDIASILPNFTERTFAEILTRENALLSKVNLLLEEVREMQKVNESEDAVIQKFEVDYKRAIIRKLDELELFGIDLSGTSKRYKLSVAYVSLLVEYYNTTNFTLEKTSIEDSNLTSEKKEEEQIDVLSIDKVLSQTDRLLVRGSAGSGKTTLIKWIAVMAASNRLDNELSSWNSCIPFFIRLREFSDGKLPNPKNFVSLISPALGDEMPEKWVRTKLKQGKAILLVDGIDELVKSQRRKVKAWIKDIDSLYPNNKWIVTSRPYAAKKEWLSDLNFMDANLQEMSGGDVEVFIEHWHDAVKDVENDNEQKEKLDRLATKLKSTLKENYNIRRLATNPLLCAMICALHRDRSTQLPSYRIHLYEACIDMFFRRDIERAIILEDYQNIDVPQKRVLLEDLAYWLIKNGWSEVEVEKVDKRFSNKLKMLSHLPKNITGTGIRRYFVERSGILRQPTVRDIDFPHRTFQEYLAAKAIANEGDIGVLAKHAADDQWQEVIQLACGLIRKKEANDLILKIIELGDNNKKQKAQLHILAVTCLETIIEINRNTQIEVQKRLKHLVPPNSLEITKNLAKAGDLVVPFLKYNDSLTVKKLTKCVRTLAMIGTENAIMVLKDYCVDKRKSVQKEILNGIKYCPNQENYVNTIKLNIKELYLDRNMPINIICSLPQLESISVSEDKLKYLNKIAQIKTCRRLDLSGTSIRNLDSLENMQNLRSLNLKNTRVKDLKPIKNLKKIQNLNLLDTEIQNFTTLPSLNNFHKLIIGDYHSSRIWDLEKGTLCISNKYIKNISFVKRFKEITNAFILKRNIYDISALSNLKKLRRLVIIEGRIKDISPLSQLQNLEELIIINNPVKNLNSLSQLQSLKELIIISSSIKDLTPISRLQNLKKLTIICKTVENIAPLTKLRNLERLSVHNCSVKNILPIKYIKNLKFLSIDFQLIQNADFLSIFKMIERVYIHTERIKPTREYIITIEAQNPNIRFNNAHYYLTIMRKRYH